MTKRRTFLRGLTAAGATGLVAGCLGGGSGSNTTTEPQDTAADTDTDTPTETSSPTPEPANYGNGELNFVMSPSEPQDLMLKQYQPVKEYLSDELPVPAKLKYGRNYSAVLQAVGSGTSDVAETGPFAAALGVLSDRAEIALQRYAYGSWKYTSVIVTKEDSDIESLSDLKGEKVAFADRLSASGALFPLYMLKQAGLNVGDLPQSAGSAEFDATFSSHAAAFAALENDQAAAAGVGQFITLNDDRELKDGFRYVKTYDGIPRAPIVVSPKISDEEREMFVSAMEEAPDSMYLGADGEGDTDDDLWFSDVRGADLDTYKPVIDVAKDLGIKTELLDQA